MPKDVLSSAYARTGARGQWPTEPPLDSIPTAASNRADGKEDPVPGILQRVAAIARVMVPSPPLTASPLTDPHSSDSDDSGTSGSGWESGESDMVDMEGNLELELDTGDATFATS